jgi:hypothetical protein
MMSTMMRLVLLSLLALGLSSAPMMTSDAVAEEAAEQALIKVVQTPSSGAYAAWGGMYVSNFCITAAEGCWVTFKNEEFHMQWPEGEAHGKVGKGNVIEADWKGISGRTGKITLNFLQAKAQLVGSWGYGGSYNSGGDITFGRPKSK